MMIINNQPNIQRQVGLNKMKTGLSSSTCPSLYGIHNCFNMNNLGCCVYAYPCCWEEVIPRVYMIKDTPGGWNTGNSSSLEVPGRQKGNYRAFPISY